MKSVNVMKEKCSLNELPLNTNAVIDSINCKENIINRIYDFGITEDSIIRPVFKSPFGDPTAYLIKNTIVALRNADSSYIIVTPIE